MRTVGGHGQGSAVRLSVYKQTNNAAVLPQRGVHARFRIGGDSWHASGSAEQNLIQVLSPLAVAKHGQTSCDWESPLGNSISHVVPDAVERSAADRFRHPETIQYGHTGGHQSLAARLLSRKAARARTAPLLNHDVPAEFASADLCKAATGNQNVSHGLLRIGATLRAGCPSLPGQWAGV
jgi:hypothetical protein